MFLRMTQGGKRVIGRIKIPPRKIWFKENYIQFSAHSFKYLCAKSWN
uniref:Uncharacterized protein n=1 Tax=Phage sp. ctGns7 TaxID=2828003 RepID=A0A8S5S9A0_9VIRU|nr:MAG TPA: hypothetical protein [Phage sp. ctGns7]